MPATPSPVLVDIGRAIADARRRARWSQRELSARSQVSQATVCRIERARSPRVSLITLDHLLAILGVRYRIEFDLPGSAIRQRDRVHAWAMGALRRRLRRLGFDVAGEVEIGDGRIRGWIDALAFRGTDRLLAIGELKSELIDVGDLERQISWYEREAMSAAVRRGWRPRHVIAVVFLVATAANDVRLRENAVVLREAFPGRAVELRRVISGADPQQRRYLVSIDPASRSSAWILPTILDGSRRQPPYRDYADAARRAATR